jgi:outer membrane protein
VRGYINSQTKNTKKKKMKKVFITLAVLLTSTLASYAQKYCIVDSKYILENLSEYKDAQKRLDDISGQWQKEIDLKFAEVDRLYKAYQAEQVMLSDEMKQRRQSDIVEKEKQAKELQKKRFGMEGDLFKKRQELVKPVQDKVYNAIQKLAVNKNYDLILDKSAGITVFYSDNKIDKSLDVLKELGVLNPTPRK